MMPKAPVSFLVPEGGGRLDVVAAARTLIQFGSCSRTIT